MQADVTPKNVLVEMQEIGIPDELDVSVDNVKARLRNYRDRNRMGLDKRKNVQIQNGIQSPL